MEEIKAYLKHLRISPRKTRLVADQIRGLSFDKAASQLKFILKESARPLLKLLMSAAASAKQADLREDRLFVKELKVDQGKTLKRYMPRARGRATVIRKKSSNITLILAEHK